MTTTHRILAEAKAASSSPRTRVTRVRAYAFEARTPPAEIQLWNVGDNPTDYGVHKWTARSSEDVLARYEARGNPLLIDVEHNGATTEDAAPTETAGYARLELRAGAPWLVFEWSAYAVDQIATGQRRYLSPEYDVDRTTGEITALYRVSLVADPGTHCARVLAVASQQETRMDPTLAAIMAILSSVADPAAAVESIKSLVASLSGGGEGDPAAEPAVGDGEGDAAAAAASDAGGDPPAGGDKKDKGDTSAMAPVKAASPAVTPPAAPAASPSLAQLHQAAALAVTQIENAQRDHLLATSGDRLAPSIRVWAATQPFSVVRGLLNAAPKELGAPVRVAATRGATHGVAAEPHGLQGPELEQLQKNMGTFKLAAPERHVTASGVLVLPSVPPSLHRERLRASASAAAAFAAGKIGQ